MRRTFDGQTGLPARSRSTWGERALVLGGFAVAALYSAASLALGIGAEAIGPLWLAAVLWTVPTGLACALWQGFRHRDWSPFRRYRFPDDGDNFDWGTKTGRYAWHRIQEEHHRLMRGS